MRHACDMSHASFIDFILSKMAHLCMSSKLFLSFFLLEQTQICHIICSNNCHLIFKRFINQKPFRETHSRFSGVQDYRWYMQNNLDQTWIRSWLQVNDLHTDRKRSSYVNGPWILKYYNYFTENLRSLNEKYTIKDSFISYQKAETYLRSYTVIALLFMIEKFTNE